MSTPSPSPGTYPSAQASSLRDPIAIQTARLQARIAKLQAQERRQRLIEDLESPKRIAGGFRFIHAFLIVLALHVVAVGGFFGIAALRKNHAADKLALAENPPIYAGVQDASPPPTHAPEAIIKAPPHQGMTSKEAKPFPRKLSASKSKHHSTQEPSAKVRELFAKMHPSASVGSSSHETSAEAQNVERTRTGVSSPSQTSSPKVHKVLPGESLAQIAKANGIKTSSLREANHLDQSDDLKVGQRLTVPEPDAHPPLQLVDKDPEALSPKSDSPEQFVPKLEQIAPNGIYTVQKGDNPYTVAHRLGVSFTDLMTANNISDPADVTIGMRLKVPGGGLAAN